MSAIIADVQRTLADAEFSTMRLENLGRDVIAFESATVLGFAWVYLTTADLLTNWKEDCDRVVRASQTGLRRAETKAWNTYALFLAEDSATLAESVHLVAIEEDLTVTRKIARAGIVSRDEVRLALLPLLTIQSTPRLEAVDMADEIRLRTTEIPSKIVEAFLSGTPIQTVVRLIEEEP